MKWDVSHEREVVSDVRNDAVLEINTKFKSHVSASADHAASVIDHRTFTSQYQHVPSNSS